MTFEKKEAKIDPKDIELFQILQVQFLKKKKKKKNTTDTGGW